MSEFYPSEEAMKAISPTNKKKLINYKKKYESLMEKNKDFNTIFTNVEQLLLKQKIHIDMQYNLFKLYENKTHDSEWGPFRAPIKFTIKGKTGNYQIDMKQLSCSCPHWKKINPYSNVDQVNLCKHMKKILYIRDLIDELQ